MGSASAPNQQAAILLRNRWIVATTLGLAFSGCLAVPWVLSFPRNLIATAGSWLFVSALGGIVVGAAQWLILRRALSNAWAWWLVSGGGWFLSALLALPFGNDTDMGLRSNGFPTFIVIGCIGGFLLGILQWIVFWRRSRRGWIWLLASIIGATVGAFVGYFLGIFVFLVTGMIAQMGEAARLIHFSLVGATMGVVAGGIYGLATALALRAVVPTAPTPKAEDQPGSGVAT